MSQRIAFFDFDGTITTKDTLLEFIKFSKGSFLFYLGFALNSPWLVAYRVKVISNQAAKERILRWFFRNMPLPVFQELCDRFAQTRIPGLIRPKALQEIKQLQEKGFTVVIVSASPENWLSKWAEQIPVSLLATKLESKPGKLLSAADVSAEVPTAVGAGKGRAAQVSETRLTGRILGRNCYGEEKVRRVREAYCLDDYQDIYAYGDTRGDSPMLALAGKSFMKPFR